MPTATSPRSKFDRTLLLSILSQPSAPFREAHVISRICEALDEARVPYFSDPIGNLVLGVSSKKEYLSLTREKNSEPLRVFIAHMDHPGFHGAAWKSETELEVKWHGGSPTQHIEGAKVWLADRERSLGHGKFTSVKMIPSGRAIESGVIEVSTALKDQHSDARMIYGGFGFREPVWQEGELLYTKAADDLVGSFAIVTLAKELFAKSKGKGKTEAPAVFGTSDPRRGSGLHRCDRPLRAGLAERSAPPCLVRQPRNLSHAAGRRYRQRSGRAPGRSHDGFRFSCAAGFQRTRAHRAA